MHSVDASDGHVARAYRSPSTHTNSLLVLVYLSRLVDVSHHNVHALGRYVAQHSLRPNVFNDRGQNASQLMTNVTVNASADCRECCL
jgi:hypothetical protein